jgi:NADP-dependent 3-hydroxy acid dehydrogenase YdfG
MSQVQGKVAIVTGASSGIGRAVALDLASAGAQVVAVARRRAELDKLFGAVKGVLPISGDVADPAFPDALLATTLRQLGRCDVLFHGAGIMHTGTVESADIDKMCEMVRVNLEAAVRITYVMAKHFKKEGAGFLIHVSSILGTKVRPGAGVYAATKYGIEALCESLRLELAGTRIRVSVVEPGITETGLHAHFAVRPQVAQGITAPLQPEDIARCVRFILEQPEHVRIPVIMALPGEQAM